MSLKVKGKEIKKNKKNGKTGFKVETTNPKPNYNFGEPFNKQNYSWATARKRIEGMKYEPKRFVTGLDSLDEVTRGIPYGLTILVGPAGSGKSLLAKAIANRHPALYILADSYADTPTGKHVQVADYLSYLPKWRKALDQMFGLARDTKVNLVVVDSITKFASSTTKAVEEADLRPALFEIAKRSEGRIPVICLSEVRGHGDWTYPAGGAAVAHAANMLIKFGKIRIQAPWEARRYDCEVGDLIWTIYIQKDKHGLAKQGHEFTIRYNSDLNWPSLIPIKEKEPEPKEERDE